MIDSFTIKVCVQTLTGDSLTLDTKVHLNLNDIKEQIETQWHIPVALQKLICDPGGAASIQDACSQFAPLPMSMAVTADECYEDLRGESTSKKRKALEQLKRLPRKFKIDTASLERCLRQDDSRTHALDTLQAREGVGAVAGALVRQACLGNADVDPLGRVWALKKLRHCAQPNDDGVLTGIRPALTDGDVRVRKAALDTFQELSNNQVLIIKVLSERLGDGSEFIQRSAIKKLVSMGGEGITAMCQWVVQAQPLNRNLWMLKALMKAVPAAPTPATLQQHVHIIKATLDSCADPANAEESFELQLQISQAQRLREQVSVRWFDLF